MLDEAAELADALLENASGKRRDPGGMVVLSLLAGVPAGALSLWFLPPSFIPNFGTALAAGGLISLGVGVLVSGLRWMGQLQWLPRLDGVRFAAGFCFAFALALTREAWFFLQTLF